IGQLEGLWTDTGFQVRRLVLREELSREAVLALSKKLSLYSEVNAKLLDTGLQDDYLFLTLTCDFGSAPWPVVYPPGNAREQEWNLQLVPQLERPWAQKAIEIDLDNRPLHLTIVTAVLEG